MLKIVASSSLAAAFSKRFNARTFGSAALYRIVELPRFRQLSRAYARSSQTPAG
jgi:hypothetical protein